MVGEERKGWRIVLATGEVLPVLATTSPGRSGRTWAVASVGERDTADEVARSSNISFADPADAIENAVRLLAATMLSTRGARVREVAAPGEPTRDEAVTAAITATRARAVAACEAVATTEAHRPARKRNGLEHAMWLAGFLAAARRCAAAVGTDAPPAAPPSEAPDA
jgi:hypothetical protein